MKTILLLALVALICADNLNFLENPVVKFNAYSAVVSAKKGSTLEKVFFFAIPFFMRSEVTLDYENDRMIIDMPEALADRTGHFTLMKKEMKEAQTTSWKERVTFSQNFVSIVVDLKPTAEFLPTVRTSGNTTFNTVKLTQTQPLSKITRRLDIYIDFDVR